MNDERPRWFRTLFAGWGIGLIVVMTLSPLEAIWSMLSRGAVDLLEIPKTFGFFAVFSLWAMIYPIVPPALIQLVCIWSVCKIAPSHRLEWYRALPFALLVGAAMSSLYYVIIDAFNGRYVSPEHIVTWLVCQHETRLILSCVGSAIILLFSLGRRRKGVVLMVPWIILPSALAVDLSAYYAMTLQESQVGLIFAWGVWHGTARANIVLGISMAYLWRKLLRNEYVSVYDETTDDVCVDQK